MDWPHILVLPPTRLAIEVPLQEAIDIDKGMPIDYHAAKWFTNGGKVPAKGIDGAEFDSRQPTGRRIPRDDSRSRDQFGKNAVATDSAATLSAPGLVRGLSVRVSPSNGFAVKWEPAFRISGKSGGW